MPDNESPAAQYPLFLDEPASVDLLSFDAVAATAVAALTDDALDPIALGLSGAWGSGKTSVLRLIAAQLAPAAGQPKERLVVETDPWRYDPQMGAKESLIGEVLEAIALEIPETEAGEKAKALLKRLVRRIDWGKALRVAATSAITVSLPSIDALAGLVRPKEVEEDPDPITDMTAFRSEFKRLLGLEGLGHLKNVVVLVDDLDRCLPETVVETLETIRLFLSVPKMSFVIAADEARVAEAIIENKSGVEVIRNPPRATVDGVDHGRDFDGIQKQPDGSYWAIEIKSGRGAHRSPAQNAFDKLVSYDNPATLTLRDGTEVKVTKVDVIKVNDESTGG